MENNNLTKKIYYLEYYAKIAAIVAILLMILVLIITMANMPNKLSLGLAENTTCWIGKPEVAGDYGYKNDFFGYNARHCAALDCSAVNKYYGEIICLV